MAKAARWSDLTGTKRSDKPWLDGMPRVIFVGDMGDLFSRAVPFTYLLDEVIETAMSAKGRRHIWMLLTKQPVRAVKFAEWLLERGWGWPENVWMGTSITSEKTENRAEILAYHPAPVKFLSVEPLLGPVSFARHLLLNYRLVIVGGESTQGKHRARPCDLAWIRDLIAQCRRADVPVFCKQLGSHVMGYQGDLGWGGPGGASGSRRLRLKDSHGGDMSEFPADLRVREFPALAAAPEALR